MAGRGHLTQPAETQRGDGNRQSVVGVVPVRASRRQDPDPRRQSGRHIHDGLAGCDKLLRQQIAQPCGGLDRPPARPERFRPRHQLVHLGHPSTNLLADHLILAAIDRHGCVTRLVRVDTNDHCHVYLRSLVWGEPWRALLLRVVRARSSFEPHHVETLTRRSSFESQTRDQRRPAGTSRATPQGPLNATDCL
jgi:hypothetical protein